MPKKPKKKKDGKKQSGSAGAVSTCVLLKDHHYDFLKLLFIDLINAVNTDTDFKIVINERSVSDYFSQMEEYDGGSYSKKDIIIIFFNCLSEFLKTIKTQDKVLYDIKTGFIAICRSIISSYVDLSNQSVVESTSDSG